MSAKVHQLELFRATALRDVPSYRDDLDLMALPCFSISKNPRHEPIEHQYERDGRKYYIKIAGGEDGIATIWDNDILIYIRTVIQTAINNSEGVSNRIQFTVADCLRHTGRHVGGKDYEAFLSALKRLKTTTVFTNITGNDIIADEGFGWIQSYRLIRSRKASGQEIMSACEITLSDWVFQAIITGSRSLSIDPAYFELSGGMERKLYMIARKHVGHQTIPWAIHLSNLYQRVGSQTNLRQFKQGLQKVIANGGLPNYEVELVEEIAIVGSKALRRRDPKVVFRRKRM